MSKRLKFADKPVYIFDLDGTLIDSMGVWSQNMLSLFTKFNITPPDNLIRTITPMSDVTIAAFLAECGIPMSPAEIQQYNRAVAQHAYSYEIPAKPTVVETVKTMKDMGVRMFVVTASPHVVLDPALKRLGIYDDFEGVWSSDDFAYVKADTRLYPQLAARIGVRTDECVFIDDNPEVVKNAKKMGMTTIGIYDESSAAAQDVIKAHADLYILQMDEIFEA